MKSVYDRYKEAIEKDSKARDAKKIIQDSGRAFDHIGKDVRSESVDEAVKGVLTENRLTDDYNHCLSAWRLGSLEESYISELADERTYSMKFSKKKRDAHNQKVEELAQLFPEAEALKVRPIWKIKFNRETTSAVILGAAIGATELIYRTGYGYSADDHKALIYAAITSGIIGAVALNVLIPTKRKTVENVLNQYRELKEARYGKQFMIGND